MSRAGARVRGWLAAFACMACAAKPSVIAFGGATSTPVERGSDARARPHELKAAEVARGEEGATAAATVPPSPAASGPNGPAVAAPAATTASVPAKVGDGYLRTTVLEMDLSLATDVGDGPETLHMTINTRNEVRFKVTAVTDGHPAAFALTYGVCRTKTSGPGKVQSIRVDLTQGKAYEVTLDGNELRVSARSDTKVSDAEVKSVREDVRKYLILDSKLRAATSGTAVDLESLSHVLASQDKHSEISEGSATFRRLETLPSGKKAAVYDVHLGFAGSEHGVALKGTLDGTMLLATKPWRVVELKSHGPLTFLMTDEDLPGGGSGTMALAVTFSR